MNFFKNKLNTGTLLMATAITVLSACNKDVEQFPNPTVTPPTGQSLGQVLAATPDDSLYFRMVVRGGLLPLISNNATSYTMFVPTNAAVRSFVNIASGGLIPANAPDAVHSAFISTTLPAASAAGIVSYNICPQRIMAAAITTNFPNLQYPSILNPAPAVSSLLRLTTFPSRRSNGAWLNNIPLGVVDVNAANGVIHHTAAVNAPPSIFLWNKIESDPALDLLEAAVNRADMDPTAPGALRAALLNIGANLTVFAPDTTAFKNVLSFLSGGLIPANAPVANFSAFIGSLPIATVKGIVVYHVLGRRAFSVNLPTTAISSPTLLNGAVPTHPGVSVVATFTTIPGFGTVAATATVKGVVNATASNITNRDNHYLNGVLHVIDQVLLPQ
jgi:uncharacterized surface protein with fasciclin (FAS1) repeats